MAEAHIKMQLYSSIVENKIPSRLFRDFGIEDLTILLSLILVLQYP